MCNKRLWLVLGLMLAVSGILSWRLFNLQVLEGTSWRAQAQGQQRYFAQTRGERGNIYLNSLGEELIPVAVNRKIYHAYISPRELRGKEEEDFALQVSKILDIEEESILERMEKDSAYEVLKRNLSPEEIEGVRKTSGIHLQEEVVRHYPEESLAANVLGFVGGEEVGQYGVEQYYEEVIGGGFGIREGLKNPWGLFILKDSTKKGEDIVLTIDYNIQHFVERALKEAVERLNAVDGAVLVGDPKTGEILAMANYPSFNPNRYGEFDVRVFKNSSVQETYEPGSVFKPVTMAAALDRGAISPKDTFYDTGEKRIHGRTIRNYDRRSYGLVTMTEILERSINTGVVYVKDQIGNDVFLNYLEMFGIFRPTGIDLHGEVYSLNKSFLEGHDVNFATASYGQGIEITDVQLFRAFSAIANGGRMINPHIVKREEKIPVPEERIISPTSSLLVTEMMVSTIERGFGNAAKVPGYHIAGKTGTAQIPWSKLGISRAGYSDRTMQAFIGYAPAFDPEFVILVKLNQPQARTAEVSAAPVFKDIAEYILEYKKIPYDYEIAN